jgi:uncharacterized membrane protein
MKMIFMRYLVFPLLLLAGGIFAYRLTQVPSRTETAIFCIAFFLIPTLKYPKIGVYYLFCLPLFIPLFRRMYYLISERPTVDYLLLISDGVMGGLILALILLWVLNKERSRDLMSTLIFAYTALLFLKVFVGNQSGTIEGLYGFKFNGLYVFFFFGGSYILTTLKETKSVYTWTSVLLLITALYAIKQILFGFSDFEQKWLDSIRFTTLRIEGVVRPFSTYLSPAAMSDGMTILFIVGIYWMVVKGRHMALFGLLLCASSVAPILIATVRTNWLAVVAGAFFYLFYLRLKNKWVKIGIMAVMMIAMIVYSAKSGGEGAGAGYAAVQNQAAGKRSLTEIMIKNRTAALANPLQEYSVQKRLETWVTILYMSKIFPFGKGQGTTGYAHSYYFQVLGEIGYPGIMLFLAILIVGFYRGFMILSLSRDPDVQELTRLMLTIVFMLSVLNLTGTHLHTPPGDVFFWFSLGCISRFYRQAREEEKARKAMGEGVDADAAGGDGPVEALAGGAHG